MHNKKILLSFLLVVIIALSVSSVSAENTTDIVAADGSSDLLSAKIQPATNTADAIQNATKNAKTGDTVDLSKYSTYDFGNKTVNISTANIIIDGKGNTTIKGHGAGDGLFYVTASNVTIKGIKFINTNPKNNFTYGGSVNGVAVKFKGVPSGLISESEFSDFNNAVIVQKSTNVKLENNKINGGYTTVITNDPTKNDEKGSKAFNIYGQSSKITVKGNTFTGPMLDAVSISQGSGSNIVENNTFINNTYSIYFGGASTINSRISNNKIINCGQFKRNGQDWTRLPVISIQKASNNISIDNNYFEAIDNNVLIAAEQGNEAHGFPTSLGNINVTDNTVKLYTSSVNPGSVTLFHILIRNGELSVFAPINVTNNNLENGVREVDIWNTNWGAEYSQNNGIVIPVVKKSTPTLIITNVTYTSGESGILNMTLTNNTGGKLADKTLYVSINGTIKEVITNNKGVVSLELNYTDAGVYDITVTFTGDYENNAVIGTAKLTVNPKKEQKPQSTPKVTTLVVKKATLKVKKYKKVSVSLKASGKGVAGKIIYIKINGKTFKGKTNSKGVASIKVKVTKKGTFKALITFKGDSDYKEAIKNVKFTVNK